MKPTLRAVAFVLASLSAAPVARAAEFEKVVTVARGASLDVRLFGGEVVVRVWDRDAVRVRATHFATDTIDVAIAGNEVTVRARAGSGKPHAIDFAIEVPRWMPLSIAGTYLDISMEGTAAPVTARTVRGDVRLTGGAGEIVLASTEGRVVVEGGRGRATLESVNNGIRVTGFEGELTAETVSGSLTLDSIAARSVAASTTSGDISWGGPFADGGRYQFVTHSGDLDVKLADPANATLAVRSFEGHVHSTLAAELPDLPARRKRFTLTLGSGAAHVDLETFTGTISLRQQ